MHDRTARREFVQDDKATKRVHLNAYVRRVGADTRNFRRYTIEEPGPSGYKRTRATIRIDAKNEIACVVDEFALTKEEAEKIKAKLAPTKEESEAIKAELEQFPFPRSIPATGINKLTAFLGNPPKEHLSIFYEQNGKDILMVQFRRNGEKPDLPYSYWSDGIWRNMEPDGLLPLWGLEKLKGKSNFMIHEGAKAARDVSAMVERRCATHPWLGDLKDYAHLGWPGGALNAGHVDWAPIKNLSPDDNVVLVCDADQVGKEAATRISGILRRPLSAIMFDDRFPPGFDLADDWPTRPEWWDGDKYKGPLFEDCLVHATWATEMIPSKGKGRPAFKVRKQFAKEWLWSSDPPVFIQKSRTDRLLDDARFNRAVSPFSDVDNPGRLLTRLISSQADAVTYDPSKRSGLINADGRRLINTYRAPKIEAIKGDPRPFLEFMKHLIPEDGDRDPLERWCATLIARPDIRMSYAVLLVSETQGVGKTTLGEGILTPLLGAWNVSFPTENQIVKADFNDWQAHKRLGVVHEIYAGQSRKGYNNIKSVITETLCDVNQKYMPSYRIDNWIHILACSNSTRALHFDDDDRRWLVPRVTEKKQNEQFWRDLHKWLRDDGLGIIRHWADEYVKSDPGPVLQGQHAPETSLKREMVAEGRSDGERLAYDLALSIRDLVDVKNCVGCRGCKRLG